MAWSYFPACPVLDVPEGGKKRVIVEGYALCLFQIDGTLYAAADACPHERVSLADGGKMVRGRIVCGAHHWVFDPKTGVCETDAGHSLRRFPVGRKDGMIYVGFWEAEG